MLGNLGQVALLQGDLEQAESPLTDGVARKRGDMPPSEALVREARAVAWEVRDPSQCMLGLEVRAETAGRATPAFAAGGGGVGGG